MASNNSEKAKLTDYEWLSMYYQTAREYTAVLEDDFDTVKRRIVDKNEDDLKTNSKLNCLLAKNAVKNYVQIITKYIDNLGELKVDIIKELKVRYPDIEGDWMSENSVTVTSSVKSPDIDDCPPKSEDVLEENHTSKDPSENHTSEESINAEGQDTESVKENKKSRSIKKSKRTRRITKELNKNSSRLVSGSEEVDNKTISYSKSNTDEEIDKTSTGSVKINTVGETEKNSSLSLRSSTVEETEENSSLSLRSSTVEETEENSSRSLRGSIREETGKNPKLSMRKKTSEINDSTQSESDTDDEALQGSKSRGNDDNGVPREVQENQKADKEIENKGNESLVTEEIIELSNDEDLEVEEQMFSPYVIPATPESPMLVDPLQIDYSEDDKSDSTVPATSKRGEHSKLNSNHENEDTLIVSPTTSIAKTDVTTPCVLTPSTTAKEKKVTKESTMDKETRSAKKLVLMSDSSGDDEDFKPTPRRKPNKTNDKDKKSPGNTEKVSHSDRAASEDLDANADTKARPESKNIRSRGGKKRMDHDYWKTHNIKDDIKLQNVKKTVVLLHKLDKVMEAELEKRGVIHVASDSESESEIADKRISRALKNFDKFDPLVKGDEKKGSRTSGKRTRKTNERKCKTDTKYKLDAISEESSDSEVHVSIPKTSKISKVQNLSSSDEDISSLNNSGSDDEIARKKVLGDSDDEKIAKKQRKEKRETADKSTKDSSDSKKRYYTPAVCRLDLSTTDEDEKGESKPRKSKDSKATTRRSRKFSEDNSSDEFVPKTKRTFKRGKKVSSGTEEISDSTSEDDVSGSDSSFGGKKSKRRKKRQKNSSEEEYTTKKKRRRRIKVADSDDSDNSNASAKQNGSDSDVQEVQNEKNDAESPSKGRKKIRKVMGKKELEKTTREAEKEEEERKRRILEKQKLFNVVESVVESDVIETLVLDMDPKTKEPVISVDPSVVCKLKPHQVNGVKFMYDCTVESIEQIKNEHQGGGCIIAHCMGLGKTLTTIGFLHSALTHKELNFKTALVICPLNTVTNWYNELNSWLREADKSVFVHKLWDQKTNKDRAEVLAYFMRKGGVGIIHYDLFRRLADINTQKKVSDKIKKQVLESLIDPGADIVVCDEGHILKNDKSKLSVAVNKIRTRRRIVLTGTPLQNNLAEYHTMMSFVKPKLLGTLKEFTNRFVNPIKNGQHADSGDYDVKLMKKRAHVLHKLLDGCVQRLDYSILTPYLPPKHEYVVMVKITPKQVELYKYYLENLMSRTSALERHKSILKNYACLLKIWTHPIMLTLSRRKKRDGSNSEDSEGSMKDFIVDGSEESESGDSGSDDDWVSAHNKKIKKKAIEEKTKEDTVEAVDENLDQTPLELPADWYLKFFESKQDMEAVELSGKLVVLMEIVKICESVGDKLLVFSQYLHSLNMIEEFLATWDAEGKENEKKSAITFPQNLGLSTGRWRKNIEYYRIDGGTKTDVRQDQCDKFNSKHTSRTKLFLISTRAGGLGINLVGANRVVIFDASWNPSHDMQSVFRVFRFGQKKPCYIYRLLAEGTMEEKIYNRQVVKLSLSGRVVDEHQIERHFKFEETNALYTYDDPDEKVDRPIPPVPKDRLLADLLISHKDRITTYLEHDTLLENKMDEGLTEEERKAAWDEYHNEKDRVQQQMQQQPNTGTDSTTYIKIWQMLRGRYPQLNSDQLKAMSDSILLRINDLQRQLNYYNLHQNSLSPEEDHLRKTTIEELRQWIARALGTANSAPSQPLINTPRLPASPRVQYPPAAHLAPQMRFQPVYQSEPDVQILPQVDISGPFMNPQQRPSAEVPTSISQGMQQALSRVSGPRVWNANNLQQGPSQQPSREN